MFHEHSSPPAPSEDEDQETRAIRLHLESIEKSRIDAFNAGDFGPNSPFYENVHQDLRFHDPRAGQRHDGVLPLITQREVVEVLRKHRQVWPELRVHLVDIRTIIDHDKKHARIWTTCATTGGIDGGAAERQRVGISRFECIDGKWFLIDHEAVLGGTSPF